MERNISTLRFALHLAMEAIHTSPTKLNPTRVTLNKTTSSSPHTSSTHPMNNNSSNEVPSILSSAPQNIEPSSLPHPPLSLFRHATLQPVPSSYQSTAATDFDPPSDSPSTHPSLSSSLTTPPLPHTSKPRLQQMQHGAWRLDPYSSAYCSPKYSYAFKVQTNLPSKNPFHTRPSFPLLTFAAKDDLLHVVTSRKQGSARGHGRR